MRRFAIATENTLNKHNVKDKKALVKNSKKILDIEGLTDKEFNKLRFDSDVSFKQYGSEEDAVEKE